MCPRKNATLPPNKSASRFLNKVAPTFQRKNADKFQKNHAIRHPRRYAQRCQKRFVDLVVATIKHRIPELYTRRYSTALALFTTQIIFERFSKNI